MSAACPRAVAALEAGPLALITDVGDIGRLPGPARADPPRHHIFRVFGTVRQQVDKRYTSSERTFHSPRSPAEIEFPSNDPSRAELAARLGRLDPRISEAQSAARRANLVAAGA